MKKQHGNRILCVVSAAALLLTCLLPARAAMNGAIQDAMQIDLHTASVTDLVRDTDGDPASYQMGNATITGEETAGVVTVTADSGYIQLSDLAPIGATFSGGLDSEDTYVSNVDVGGKYKYLLYTSDSGVRASDLQAFVRGLVCYFDGEDSQTITVGVDYEMPRASLDDSLGLLANTEIPLKYYNGSYYGYAEAKQSIDWFTAYDLAKSASFYGEQGYLLTIESEGEHNLVYNLQGGKIGWAGATRMVEEQNAASDPDTAEEIFTTDYSNTTTYGNWYWVCGPNAGTKILDGATMAQGGPVEGQYNNWNDGEPNNYNRSEGYLEYGYGVGGKWNDYNAKQSVTGFYLEITPKDKTSDVIDSCTTSLYRVAYTLTDVASSRQDETVVGNYEDYVTTLTPVADGVLTADNVMVAVGGNWLDQAAYVFDEASGMLMIPKAQLVGDVEIIAEVQQPEPMYTVTYDWGTDAPSDVILPVDNQMYAQHDSVTPDETYTSGSTSEAPLTDIPGEDVQGVWTFSGWTTTADLTNGIEGNVTYIGKWTFTAHAAKTYTVTYEWGEVAPDDVTLPVDENSYSLHDSVTADSTYTSASISNASRDGVPGTWSFSGWTTSADLADGITSNVTYIGVWTFAASTYTVTYEWGKDAPSDVTLPVDGKSYAFHDSVTVNGIYTNASVSNAPRDGVPGTWKFSGWKTSADLADGIASNVTYIGVWTFTASTYTVTYEWGKDAPSDVTLPVDGKSYAFHDSVTVNGIYTNASVSNAPRDGVPGTWKFSGWKTSADLADGIASNVTYIGVWEFTKKSSNGNSNNGNSNNGNSNNGNGNSNDSANGNDTSNDTSDQDSVKDNLEQVIILKPNTSTGTMDKTDPPNTNQNATSGSTSQGSTAGSSPAAPQRPVTGSSQTGTGSSASGATASSSDTGKVTIRDSVTGEPNTVVGSTDDAAAEQQDEQTEYGESWAVPNSESVDGLAVSDPFTAPVGGTTSGMETGSDSSSGLLSFIMEHALGIELAVSFLLALIFAALIIPDVQVLRWLKKRRLENLWKHFR